MAELLSLLLTVLVHELGHVISSIAVGVDVRGVHARAGGLSIDALADLTSYPRALLIYSGGALANLLAALIFRHVDGAHAFSSFCVGAALFNLLPLPGSDGTMIMTTLLSWLTDSPRISYMIARTVTDVFLFLFWLAAVYMSMTGRAGILPLIFAVMMLIARLGED